VGDDDGLKVGVTVGIDGANEGIKVGFEDIVGETDGKAEGEV
jgi:hypothetical protein